MQECMKNEGVEIMDGTAEDVIRNIPLISESIPAKSGITEEEIRERLSARHGVKLAYLQGEEAGLTVWHEQNGSAYLWLGAYRIKGTGIGSLVLDALIEELIEIGYESVTVKTGSYTKAANRQMERYGFTIVEEDGDTLFWEKKLKPYLYRLRLILITALPGRAFVFLIMEATNHYEAPTTIQGDSEAMGPEGRGILQEGEIQAPQDA